MKTASVKAIWRFPVKSMQGELLNESIVGPAGLLGDRAYALVEKESGKVVSAKSIRKFPDLLMCRASYVKAPEPGKPIPPVRIQLPNGRDVESGTGEGDRVLSEHFNIDVELRQMAPEDYVIDQFHPDIADVDPSGNRNEIVEQKLGSSLFQAMGAESPLPPGSFMDVFPVSVITTSTLHHLSSLAPDTDFDVKRFRMNLVLETDGEGFVESDWIGKQVRLSDDLRLMVTLHDPRCVMTTLAQPGLENDAGVLKTLVKNNRHDILGAGQYPCAGVYAVVANPGSVALGDVVSVS